LGDFWEPIGPGAGVRGLFSADGVLWVRWASANFDFFRGFFTFLVRFLPVFGAYFALFPSMSCAYLYVNNYFSVSLAWNVRGGSPQRTQRAQRKAGMGEESAKCRVQNAEWTRLRPAGTTPGQEARLPASSATSPGQVAGASRGKSRIGGENGPRSKVYPPTCPPKPNGRRWKPWRSLPACGGEGYVRPREVMHIKVCTWHGWKKCEIGPKNR